MNAKITIEQDEKGTRFSLPNDPVLALGLLELAKIKVGEQIMQSQKKQENGKIIGAVGINADRLRSR